MTYFYHYPESPRVLAIIRYPRDPDMNLFNVRPFQLLAVMKHWRTTLEADYINDFTNRSASSSPSQDLNWRGDLADLVYLFACKLLVPLVWFCHSTLLFYYFPLQIIAVKSTIVVAPSMRSCHIEAEGTRSTMACCRRILNIELIMFIDLSKHNRTTHVVRVSRKICASS